MLGKRKAPKQLTPENEDIVEKPNFLEQAENFPESTPEEIAKRPPLIAKRRGGQPSILNPATDQPSNDSAATPTVVQPVGPAPALAESNKTEDESTKQSETEAKDTTKPSSLVIKPFDFSSGSANPFAEQTSIFGSGSGTGGFSFSENKDQKPFAFSFGSEDSSIKFTVPTSTPPSIGESEEAKVTAAPVPTTTGEEEEETKYSDTVRVYQLGTVNTDNPEGKEKESEQKDGTENSENIVKKWLERGKGELKLNVRNEDNTKSRIIVRREKTHQLVINMPLFNNITCEKASETSLRVVGFNKKIDSEELTPESYLIRQRNAKNTSELFDQIQMQIAIASTLSFGDVESKKETDKKETNNTTNEESKEPESKESESKESEVESNENKEASDSVPADEDCA